MAMFPQELQTLLNDIGKSPDDLREIGCDGQEIARIQNAIKDPQNDAVLSPQRIKEIVEAWGITPDRADRLSAAAEATFNRAVLRYNGVPVDQATHRAEEIFNSKVTDLYYARRGGGRHMP